MKNVEKIIIAGIVGTTFMTLYSYVKGRKENQEYVEPVLINKLINNSENLPYIHHENTNITGYVLHYATGIGFMALYYLLWKKVLYKPTLPKILLVGTVSGMAGIMAWKLFFMQHNRPPQNYRYGYYRQLLMAHIVFTLFAIPTYKLLDNKKYL